MTTISLSPSPRQATISPTDLQSRPYSAYYASGHYDRRYPRPNGRMLALIRHILHRSGLTHVIDFGSGNGRYVLPLLAELAVTATAIERDGVARSQLAERAARAKVAARLRILANLDELPSRPAHPSLVLTTFGVLAHITDPRTRLETLSRLYAIAGGEGRLVASVPNRTRRFLRAQVGNLLTRKSPTARIRYSRKLVGSRHSFEYHLFTTTSLASELKCAGFSIESLYCESLLPERMVTAGPTLGRFDALLSRHAPSFLGYGIAAVASPKA
ncbi:MAG TPA: methyltransferase domain-containing protein [Solirubrobacteraceae bacterium]|nr:methyltransferase domain-containing protein [Solirubrobacteraceae bacterium]